MIKRFSNTKIGLEAWLNAKIKENCRLCRESGFGSHYAHDGEKLFLINEKYYRAAHWFELALKRNDTFALVSLGILYMLGRDVKYNMGRAIELFNRAARLGNLIAYLELEKCNKQSGIKD